MNDLLEILRNIDFSNKGVQILAAYAIGFCILWGLILFFVLKRFTIPRSKICDPEAVERGIRQMMAVKNFSRIMFVFFAVVAVGLFAAHLLQVIDAFKAPFLWVLVFTLAGCMIFMGPALYLWYNRDADRLRQPQRIQNHLIQQDSATIEEVIKRLKRLKLFSKTMLILFAAVGVGLVTLHLLQVIDIFEAPFSKIGTLDVVGLIIFVSAALVPYRYPGLNERELKQLQQMKNDSKNR